MGDMELDLAISENLERGFFGADSLDKYRMTKRGSRYVELLKVRANMPALAELLGVLTTADPRGDIFAAALQELQASLPWEDWPGIMFVSGSRRDAAAGE